MKKYFCLLFILLLILNTGVLPKNVSAQSLERFLEWNEAGDTFKKFGGPGGPIIIHTGAIGFTNCFDVPNGVRDGFFRSADIYIISDLPNLPIGSQLNDVGGVPNTITSAASGGLFIEELIGFTGNNIGEGTYSIVYDECQDGKLGPEDKVFDTAFEVEIADDVPSIPSSYMQSVKADAAKEAKFWTETSTLFKYGMKAIDLVKYSTKLLQCLGDVTKMLTDEQCGLLTLVEVGNKEGVKKTDFWSIVDVKKIVQIHLLNTVKKWAAIEADPPDMNFKKLSPINITDTIKVALSEPIRSSYTKLGNSLSINNAILDSLLHSLEKYQGSVYDNNGEWGLIHAKKIKENSLLLANELSTTNSILTSLGNEFMDRSDVINNYSIFVRNTQEKLNTIGFTSNDTKFLLNHGLSSEEIIELKNIIMTEDTFKSSQISNNIQNLISLNLKTTNDLIELSNQMDNIISSLETNNEIFKLFPTSNAGGPYIINTNEQVILNGSKSFVASVPEGRNIIKWEWDLNGDLIYGDAIGETPIVSFNESFEGFLGLKVTDSTGSSDISFTKLIVMDNNNPPSINSFSPLIIPSNITLGNSIQFSVNASDLDNDQINFDWYQNDTLLSSGSSNNLNFISNSLGLKTINVEISDVNKGIDTESWSFYVVLEDVDNDSWNANVDCNDNNPEINPGTKEIYYNEIDDDCNPVTLDNNSPPIVDNQTITTLQDTSVSIVFTATDVDNDTLNFSIVDRPENGTLSDITIDQFSGLASATYTPNPNFHGTDKLTFIANDGNENSTIGTIIIDTLIAIPPVAESKSITIDEDTSTDIELNTTLSDGHQLQFELIPLTSIDGKKDTTLLGRTTPPQTIDHDSAVTRYTPLPNYQSGTFGMGEDGMIFNVLDPPLTPDQSSQSQGQINIHINPINDSPFSFSKTVRTVENTPIDIFFRAIDLENDFILNSNLNNGIKFSILDLPTHGTLGGLQENVLGFNQDLQVNSTENWITYTPSPGFIGEDNFTISANDGNLTGKQSNITIKVSPQNPEMKSQFAIGDLLVIDGFGLQWLDPDGTANKRTDLITGASVSGGAFDLEGNVYVPEYNGGIVSKYDNAGNLIDQFGDKINDYECRVSSVNNQTLCDFWPTAITFDRNGSAYIGGEVFATDQSRDALDDIRKFDSNGNLVQKYDVDVSSSGIFGLELGADQCTLYYSSWEGPNTGDPNRDIIKRFDVCENRQLTDFANIFQDVLYDELRFGHQPILDFKLLPDGGMIVAHNAFIHHLDSSGKIIKTYNIAKGVGNLAAVALDADRKSFWAAAQLHLYKIDIDTGEVIQFFDIEPFGGITGTLVYGEPKPSLTEISPIVIDQDIVANQNTPVILNLTGFDANKDPMTFSIINQPQNGTLGQITQINSNLSQVTYIPNNDIDINTDLITYSSTDNTGRDSSNTGIIKILINHRPIAIDDFASTLQEVPINIPVLDNDTDFDVNNPLLNDSIQIASVNTTNTLGDVIVNNNNNTVTFVPFSTFSGIDSFTYTISDNNKFTDTANVTVNIRTSNIPPIANPQTISIVENTPINLTLTATDPNSNDNLTFIRGSDPLNGFLNNFNATTGQIQYRPLHNFDGIDTFSFKAFDGKDASQPANVTIFITEDGINDPPVIESERVSANVSQQIIVDVLQNDIDPDGDLLTLTNFTGPFNGTAVLNQDQTITYQSDPDFNNSDVLYYRVADPSGDFDIGQLIIDVQGNADNQIIQVPSDRFVTTMRNQPIDIELVATATIDRPVAFFIIVSTSNGTLGDITNLSNLTSSISYTPNNGFVGDDSFTYASIDANGVVSNVGTIRISVNEIAGNPPIARNSQVMLEEDTSIPIQLDASDSDVNDVLTYSIESQPVSGKITSFDPSTGSLVYEPNPNFNGNDAFLFKAVDQNGLESNIATVHIIVSPVNDPPIANNHQLETDQNSSLQITLSGSDHIDNGAISQFRIVNNPTNGQISNFNQMTGELTYTPNNNFFGSDSFAYKVIDNQGLESTEAALISINVKALPPPVNNPPIAVDKTVETNNNTPINIILEGTETDQGDTINTFTIVSNPSNGQIINFNSNTGTLTYIPNSNFVGQDSFTFKVTDSRGLNSNNNGLVTINVKSQPPPTNNPPVAIDKIVETNSNTPVSVKLEGRDADQGDSISGFTMISSPTNGQISNFNSNTGILIYTPNNNFVGQDTFTFKTVDSHGLESINTGLISINVKSLPPSENNPPVAFDKIMSTNSNIPVNITLEASDNDTGDTIKSFNVISNPLHGQISNFNSETGKLTYIPNSNFVGQDSFTFKVTDSHGLESINTALVTINVNSAVEEKKIEISSVAKCGPGEFATGGGFALGGNATIKSSKPLGTEDGWNATALVFGTTGTPGDFLGNVTANVICFDNLPLHH